jgi:hypothetical protein
LLEETEIIYPSLQGVRNLGYSSLLNIERQQVYRIEAQGVKVGLELILGTDAFDTVSTVKVLPRDESLTAEEADSEYLD